MTDRYPPFRLDQGPDEPVPRRGRRTVADAAHRLTRATHAFLESAHGHEEPRRPLRHAQRRVGRVSSPRSSRDLTQAPGTGGPDRHTCWLATIDADGSPHVTGIGAEWADGAFWFETGPGHPEGPQPRPRPALHVERRHRRVRPRRRGRGPPGHRSRDGRGAWPSTWAAGGWPARVDESGTALDGRVQRAVGRPPAVVRVPHHGARRDRAASRSSPAAPPAGGSERDPCNRGRTVRVSSWSRTCPTPRRSRRPSIVWISAADTAS